jgi:ketosteroid isomerase-like protein
MFTLLAYLLVYSSYGQNAGVEAVIRSLEQQEVEAILKKDSVVLLKLWDKNYVVNSPDNVVVFAGKTALDRPVMARSRTSFTRDIEQVIVRGDFAFSMGSETVMPSGEGTGSNPVVKRRFTNFWEKGESGWRLVARHANVICKP